MLACGIRLRGGELSVRSMGERFKGHSIYQRKPYFTNVSHILKLNMLHGPPLLYLWITPTYYDVSPLRATLKNTYKWHLSFVYITSKNHQDSSWPKVLFSINKHF